MSRSPRPAVGASSPLTPQCRRLGPRSPPCGPPCPRSRQFDTGTCRRGGAGSGAERIPPTRLGRSPELGSEKPAGSGAQSCRAPQGSFPVPVASVLPIALVTGVYRGRLGGNEIPRGRVTCPRHSGDCRWGSSSCKNCVTWARDSISEPQLH